ncbi:MAG: phosphotransferase family protein [Steroidobacteraceae bacterium]
MTAHPSLDPPFVQRWLRERLGLPYTVLDLRPFPRGVSRETWMIDCTDAAGGRRDLVLRRDMPGGSICLTSLRFEYEVYARLAASSVPVATTLAWEDDPRWLPDGRPFFLRRAVEGSWEIRGFHDPDPRHDELRIAVGREHVRALATLHTTDWRALGFGDLMRVPATAADCALQVIDDVTADIRSVQTQPLPLVTEAVEWLRDHRPREVPAIVLLKGTSGYGEEIFRDGRLVAMSDWELARIGDPAYDWAQIQDFIGDVVVNGRQVWGLQPALDYYRDLTGFTIDPASVDYYRRLYGLYLVLMSQSAARKLQDGDRFCRLAWVAAEILHRAQCALGMAIGIAQAAKPVPGQLG